MITVTGKLVKVDGTAYENEVIFILVDTKGVATTATVGGNVVAQKQSVTPDVSGNFSIDLYANDTIGKATQYKVYIRNSVPFFIYVTSLTSPVSIFELNSAIVESVIPPYTAGDIGKVLTVTSEDTHEFVFGAGTGDMSKVVYDTNNSGVVDNAELVNGLTVETAVPIGAVFTDTIYDDTTIQSEVDLNTAKRSYPLVDENKLATIATNADVTADNETSHADVVVAPLGVLPVLDGSNLTNLPSVGGITAHGDLTGIGTLTHDQLETAIGLNTAKISFDSTSSTRLANTSGTNTGDQDLSGLQPLSTDLTNIDALVGNLGFLKKTALNTWVLDTNTYLTSETSHPSDSLDSTDITNIGNLSGVNTGDQDLSGYSVTTHNHDLVYEPIDSTILKDADIGSTVQAYDADTAKTDVGQAYTKMQRSTITTDNDGIFDLTNGTNDFKCTPTATIAITFTNILSGAKGDIILVNTTPQVITLAAGTKAPSGTATALSTAGTYRIAYLSDGTNTYIDYSEAMV